MVNKKSIVCCLGTFAWVQIIGWFQTIGFLLLSVVLFHVIEDLPDDELTHQDPDRKMIYDILVSSVVILFTGILFGAFLLVGSYTKKTAFISAWIVYTILLLFFDIICIARIIVWAISTTWLSIIVAILGVTTLLIMHGFSIFI
ncbi:unnamed protein product, partial [Allacma fusca]